ncbi:MAG: Uma2 family endonuclease [Chloroflexi bacterium]|nr:Uma2 family endonuclease [Chloroflexota bacterium]
MLTAQRTTPIQQPWPEQGQWTYEDWLRLPEDGYRYEVIDGVLHMSPPPATDHQRALSPLATRLGSYVLERRLGEVITAPCAVLLPGQGAPVQPDIFFVAAGRLHLFDSQHFNGAPDLVVEMLSPSNWAYDRREKFEAYEQAGVREYWIADYRAKTIEVYVLEEGVYSLQGQWRVGEAARSQVLEGFEIAVSDIFRL